jgi:hypothetical protein
LPSRPEDGPDAHRETLLTILRAIRTIVPSRPKRSEEEDRAARTKRNSTEKLMETEDEEGTE